MQTDRRSLQPQVSGRPIAFGQRPHLLTALLLSFLVAACGQVITVQPTPTPLPTPTLGVALLVATLPPTATPAPYTPEPTPTPTVTPTPVLHTIQSGESLLTIADQFNVSVADLQETNGILDPRLLQIGQQLIIPRRSAEEAGAGDITPTTTPTALPVTVENVYFGETNIGGLSIFGEVHNTSGVPVEQVRVGVTLLDGAGQTVATADALAALDLLDIDERRRWPSSSANCRPSLPATRSIRCGRCRPTWAATTATWRW